MTLTLLELASVLDALPSFLPVPTLNEEWRGGLVYKKYAAFRFGFGVFSPYPLFAGAKSHRTKLNNWYWYELEHKFHEQFYRAEPELLRNSALTSKLQTLRPSTPSQP